MMLVKKPQFDVLKAETDLASAKLNMIRSSNNIKLARLQLANLMGVKLKEDVSLKDNLDVDIKTDVDLNKTVEESFKNRPDFLAGRLRIEANKSLVTSAWTTHLPTLSLSAAYNWKGYVIDQKYANSWNLGLSFSLPLFQGWGIDAAVQIAKANLKSTEYSKRELKTADNS